MTTNPDGWPAEAPTLLASLAADNTHEFWQTHRVRLAEAVLAPTRAIAAALAVDFGPVRVLRPHVNRRFRPDAAPYRTDTGGVAATPRGSERGFVLSAATLSVTAGRWMFDPGQLRRFRAAVDGAAGAELERLVAALDGGTIDRRRALLGAPRGWDPHHPRIELLRLRGLQVTRAWDVGPWLAGGLPFSRIRDAWRAAGPLVAWLDEHVGPADLTTPTPRVALE